ncbi:MAG: ABC transporter ATP-binding protein [Candidatus Lokiarchaeota archaeon]|nr:ABC transporter ATP-binding protein [Candidatus Lokiarchaeota archaeon]
MQNGFILEIIDLQVEVEGKVLLKNLNLAIPKSESYVLFGPNGSGKSSLINSIMGIPPYKVTNGKILFNGKDITKIPIDQRIKAGLSMTYQHPPEIKGIKLKDIFKFCLNKKIDEDLEPEHYEMIERFKLTSFLDRNINVGFSGGERKRSEVVQMLLLKPKLILLDEPDSGVDIESLRLISKEIENYIQEHNASALIVTHQGEILNHITTKRACVLLNSTIYCYANPREIYESIKEMGFEKCIDCKQRSLKQVG